MRLTYILKKGSSIYIHIYIYPHNKKTYIKKEIISIFGWFCQEIIPTTLLGSSNISNYS